jgi:hypothetical protein
LSPLVSTSDSLGFPILGHLGAGTCAILNVNAGSKAYVRPGGNWSQDACMFNGQITCVHIEGDKTMLVPWGGTYQTRGPYVHTFDGTNWTLMGGSLDPPADSVPGVGSRFNPHNCRIATDGTDLFVAYYDYICNNTSTGAATAWVRISHWNGSSWDLVASEAMPGGTGAFGGSIPALTVANGKAYVVYTGNSPQRVRIFRSDGSSDWVAGSGPAVVSSTTSGYSYAGDGDGTYAAVTTSGGRPVGFYTKAMFNGAWGSLVAFDFDTAAIIRETPTPYGPNTLIPSGYGTGGLALLTSCAVSGYGGDKIALGTKGYGILIVPEDFSSDPVIINSEGNPLAGAPPYGDGTSFSLGMFSHFALDPADPGQKELWLNTGIDSDLFGGAMSNPTNINHWGAACGSNASSPRYKYLGTGFSVPVDHQPDSCLFGNSFFWGLYGPVIMVADGTYLYAFWCYYPGSDSGDNGTSPYWFQFIVTRWSINRTAPCGSTNSILFGSRFKGA